MTEQNDQSNTNPDVQAENRNLDGTFKPGVSGNPAGRPKGQSLKEFWRQRFQEMSYDEKIAFTEKVGNDTVWKMAEGNPKNDVELNANVSISKILDEVENVGSTIIEQIVEDATPLQDTKQTEPTDQIQSQQSPNPLQPKQVE